MSWKLVLYCDSCPMTFTSTKQTKPAGSREAVRAGWELTSTRAICPGCQRWEE